MGDIGQVSPNPSVRNDQHRDDAPIQSNSDHRLSYASGSSQSNAHVYVWPPTPAASEHGGSNDGNSKQRSIATYQNALYPDGQYAKIEHAEAEVQDRNHAPLLPIGPSQALARPLSYPILGPDGRPTHQQISTGDSRRAAEHGRAARNPLHSPTTSNEENEGYSDPNVAFHKSPLEDLGRMRRKAIEDHDGRESMVSDLDVETLRLDGSSESGDSRAWESRRDSTSTIGSFSSVKIREQRQRRSQAQVATPYSEKRSSTDTIQPSRSDASTLRDVQHRSWNGDIPEHERLDPSARGVGLPQRSNTGPDNFQAQSLHYQQQPQQANRYSNQHTPSSLVTRAPQPVQPISGSPMRTTASQVTFTTPQPDHEARKPTIAVKGATNNSPAERFLTLAITHHESGDLTRSAYYFERSAKVEGGCVVGMCMWGMALREGWGVRKDQKKGFDWISRAASRAGEMMAGSQGASGIKNEAELKAIRSELKLSVYELGKCFCYGWGVKMDKQMALEYFELAAKLGDSDAQAEAGALLAAGKGCKKDLKKAAMYYRMAEVQGYDTVGLSWIHKDKYDPVSVNK
jgi:TPR repeat protein